MLDDRYVAVADPMRRQLLAALLEAKRDVVVTDAIDVADRDPESVRVELYHVHLPKLRAGGFVDWQEGTWSVDRGPRFDELRPLLVDAESARVTGGNGQD